MKCKILIDKATRCLLCLALPVLLFSLGSCSDDDNGGSSYFLRCKINGAQIEFTQEATLTASFAQSGEQHNGLFTGYDETANVSLQVFDGKSITEGTYTAFTLSGSIFVGALIGYSDNGTLYSPDALNSDVVITIAEMTSTTVRGTFSGTLGASGKPDVKLTQGEFLVKRFN